MVFGAEKSVAYPYKDPKAADRTVAEIDTYLHTSFLVATEYSYVMNLAAKVLTSDRQN